MKPGFNEKDSQTSRLQIVVVRLTQPLINATSCVTKKVHNIHKHNNAHSGHSRVVCLLFITFALRHIGNGVRFRTAVDDQSKLRFVHGASVDGYKELFIKLVPFALSTHPQSRTDTCE